ncbi:hypothetical protein ACS5PK_21020 [Roseateles sp. DB2]|uniref:hypothetical protein n=1 Tax=Roseateles sp. DB2 TaxID=3453717 RepID=UPI003EEFC402
MSYRDRRMFGRCRRMLAALLLTLLPVIQAQAQAQAPESAASAPQQANLEALKAAILRGDSAKYQCVYAHPKGEALAFEGLCPAKEREGRALTPENGDIVVVLKAPLYLAARKAMDNKPPQLSVNGVSMAGSARLTSVSQSGDSVRLGFSVTQVDTADARVFWSTTFQRVGFSQLTPLYVTLGWPDNPNYFQPDTSDGIPDGLFITSRTRLIAATLLGLLIIGGYVAALLKSDVFRIGAQLDTGERQAYSFARVQWGVWTTFALASAVFLWAVYGVFMPLSEQMLSLMGVSTLAATTSFFMDASKPSVPVKATNLWQDLLSGSTDATAQAHRFQALAVNLLLLVSTGWYVSKHLGYPIWDPTWLAMLGLSNAAQLVGKQAVEGPAETVVQTEPLPQATVPAGPPAGFAPPQTQPAAPAELPAATVPAGPLASFPQTLQQVLPPATLPPAP